MNILIDIGGTKIRVAGSREPEKFDEPRIFPTPKTYKEGVAAIIDVARACSNGDPVEHIIAGMPGVISPGNRGVLKEPNIADWENKPLADDLEYALGGNMHIENDAAVCGMGEAHFGAGKGARVMMYLTVSTGVGGVRIVEGVISAPERSAEVGHQYVIIGDKLERLSNLISGRAIAERFGMPPRDLGKDHVVWEELARHTAIGVHNNILHWTPERVVLGGSMFNDVGISVERVEFHVREILKALPTVPQILHSQLGDLGGLWGGLALLKQQKN